MISGAPAKICFFLTTYTVAIHFAKIPQTLYKEELSLFAVIVLWVKFPGETFDLAHTKTEYRLHKDASLFINLVYKMVIAHLYCRAHWNVLWIMCDISISSYWYIVTCT